MSWVQRTTDATFHQSARTKPFGRFGSSKSKISAHLVGGVTCTGGSSNH